MAIDQANYDLVNKQPGFSNSLLSCNCEVGADKFQGLRSHVDGRKGIHDEAGPEAKLLPADKTSLELGTENQTKLIGAPATGRYISFTPAIDAFLKGHLFGDIFGRDNLDFQSRELATIAALSSMKGVNSQLQSHFNIGFNTGLSEAQMKSLIAVLAEKVGKAEADNANRVLQQALAAKKQ